MCSYTILDKDTISNTIKLLLTGKKYTAKSNIILVSDYKENIKHIKEILDNHLINELVNIIIKYCYDDFNIVHGELNFDYEFKKTKFGYEILFEHQLEKFKSKFSIDINTFLYLNMYQSSLNINMLNIATCYENNRESEHNLLNIDQIYFEEVIYSFLTIYMEKKEYLIPKNKWYDNITFNEKDNSLEIRFGLNNKSEHLVKINNLVYFKNIAATIITLYNNVDFALLSLKP